MDEGDAVHALEEEPLTVEVKTIPSGHELEDLGAGEIHFMGDEGGHHSFHAINERAVRGEDDLGDIEAGEFVVWHFRICGD